jgi:hypothetical protein
MTHIQFIIQLRDIIGDHLTLKREKNALDIAKYLSEEELDVILDEAEEDIEKTLEALDEYAHNMDDANLF